VVDLSIYSSKKRKIAAYTILTIVAVTLVGILFLTVILPDSTGKPDLTIDSVEIYPSEPKAGELFTVTAYIVNIGDGRSGQCEVKMYLTDLLGNHDYILVGESSHYAEIHPGEQIKWTHAHAPLNEPGDYQFRLEIEPLEKNDANYGNNIYQWNFTVIP
jgi:hypothetical protein